MGLAAKVSLVALLLLTAGQAPAEEVSVKYLGRINLAGFDCRHHDSSLVWRTCYHQGRRLAVVDLKGTYYGYCGLPAATMREWRAAPSMGRFFNQRIRGRFDC